MDLTNETRRRKIEDHAARQQSEEALLRKQRSLDRLKREGIPTIDHLPVIEDSAAAKIRSVQEICERAIAVCLAALKGEGLGMAETGSLIKKYDAAAFFSPNEAAFINNPAPAEKERIQFAWRYECFWTFLWVLGYVDSIGRPEGICDVAHAVGHLSTRDTAKFISDAKLRSPKEILDEADLIYRYDWAVVNSRLKNTEVPANLDGGVVQERHYALNWLIGYMDQSWDEVSTDT